MDLKEIEVLPPWLIIHEGEYTPKVKDIRFWFAVLNAAIFKNKVPKFKYIKIITRRDWHASTHAYEEDSTNDRWCELEINPKFRDFELFLAILAHEMIHNYEWTVFRRSINHGPNFFSWRDRLAKHNIPLNVSYEK